MVLLHNYSILRCLCGYLVLRKKKKKKNSLFSKILKVQKLEYATNSTFKILKFPGRGANIFPTPQKNKTYELKSLNA